MDEIGNLFTLTRQTAGVSLREVSDDLGIEEAILENIEDGRSGAFSDIFVLKKYIFNYAKYLGLDADKVVDEFNEYVFEATSKIPIKEIEKQVSQNIKLEELEEKERIMSPYTKKEKKTYNWIYFGAYTVVILCFIFAIFWCIKQISMKNAPSNTMVTERWK